ncbi:hypothetical protein [Kitasatospora sp. NPDC091276]|uniref:hypothetical protein n=1 Tax=Kitasatospora sp. NPDC091276 TaxID=3155300 RepID=UPI00342A5EF6
MLHTTAAYAAADTDELAQTIHRIRPGRAAFTLHRIALIEVYWQRTPVAGADTPGWRIRRDTLATIPLDE